MSKSTQGSRLTSATQANFYTPQTTGFTDYRTEEEPDVPPPVSEFLTSQTVHADPNQKDKKVNVGGNVDGAFTVPMLLRQATTAGQDSKLVQAFESGGFTVVDGANTTLSAYVSTTDFTLTSNNFPIGYGCAVELDDGTIVPTLVAANTAGQITPGMALPSAASTSNNVYKCNTVTPGDVGEVTSTKYLTMHGTYRVLDSTNTVVVEGQGCSLTNIGDIVLNPQELVKVEFTFSAANVIPTDTGAAVIGVNSFQDSEAYKAFDCPWFQYATASSSGGIAAAYNKILSAKISFPDVVAEKIIGIGDSECLNDLQGFMHKADMCELTIEMPYDSTKVDDWEGTNPNKYIGIILPTTSNTVPGFGFFMPNAFQSDKPETDFYSNTEIRLTLKYKGQPAGYDGTTPTDQGNQPWYLVVTDTSA